MSIQGQFNQTLGVVAAALSIFKGKEEKKPSAIDDDLKKAQTEYYKQKTKSAKLNDKYTKQATELKKQRANYQKLKNEYKQLKVDDLKEKLAKQQEKNNLNAFKSAATSSMQEVAKRLENQNLAKQNLNTVASEQSPFIQTNGTTTNIASSEDIKALEAKQQREWAIHMNRSNAAKKAWEVKNAIKNGRGISVEDIDFAIGADNNDLKKLGLTMTQLREWGRSEDAEVVANKLQEHFKGTKYDGHFDGITEWEDISKALHSAANFDKVMKQYKADEEAYYDKLIAEAENPVDAVQNKQEVKEETYSVWPKRDFSVRNTEEKKDFSETRWRR